MQQNNAHLEVVMSPPIEEYLEEYGRVGERLALQDRRVIGDELDHSQLEQEPTQSGGPPQSLRVCDIFLHHYFTQHNLHHDVLMLSYDQRDVLIKQVLEHLDE